MTGVQTCALPICIADIAGILLDLARVQEGEGPRDPADFSRRIAALLASGINSRTAD